LERENLVDICSMFSMLRRQRRGLIETEEQYRLVYTLLNRHIHTAQTIRGKAELDWLRENGINEVELKAEYLLVKQLVRPLSQGECAGAHREDNRAKNRHLHTLPPDAHRPYITSFQDNSCTDYINAVFVDGFLRSKEFIVTEWPIIQTVKDFWSMIYDHEVTSIVVLEDKVKVGGSRFPRFWPDQGTKAEYGPAFIVQRSAEGEAEKVEDQDRRSMVNGHQASDQFSVIDLQIRRRVVVPHRKTQAPWVGENQGRQLAHVSSLVAGAVVAGVEAPSRSSRLFKVENWPAGLVPLLYSLKEWEQEQGVPGRVCVVSQDGVCRVGVYTLLSYAMDQLDREQQINTIQGATTIKCHRPGILKNIQEYRLFYQLLPQIY